MWVESTVTIQVSVSEIEGNTEFDRASMLLSCPEENNLRLKVEDCFAKYLERMNIQMFDFTLTFSYILLF